MPHPSSALGRLVSLLLLACLMLGLFLAPMPRGAARVSAAPLLGPGNHVTLGSREAGVFLDVTVTGIELGAPVDMFAEGPLTSTTVTLAGTMYVSLPEGFYTKPSLKASLGGSAKVEENLVTWPPAEMRDTEGYVKGPFQHEEAFSFSYTLKPGDAFVWYMVSAGRVNGASDYIQAGGRGLIDPNNPPKAADTPAPDKAAPTKAPATSGKPPCDFPLIFYPGQDLSGFYTGKPSLNFNCGQLAQQMVDALRRYQADDGPLVDGVQSMDAKEVATTLINGRMMKAKAPALQAAARAWAKEMQYTNPAYRIDPGTLFYLSLKVNNGNVRDALLTCHAATNRSKGAPPSENKKNKDFVQNEGILADFRNLGGYAKGQVTYKTNAGRETSTTLDAMAADDQGVWYHYYGTAALEYVDRYHGAAFAGARASLWWRKGAEGDKMAQAAEALAKKGGMPISPYGGLLGNYAIALEEQVRSEEGSPPDIDKNCVNYWGLSAGGALRDRVAGLTSMDAPVACQEQWPMPKQVSPGPVGVGAGVHYQSPLSLRITGTDGEFFAFDQATKTVDGNTPLVYFDVLPEEDGTWGITVLPLFAVQSVKMEATGAGPALVAVYDPQRRVGRTYDLTVQPGDRLAVPWETKDKALSLNGAAVRPFATERVRRPLPGYLLPAAGGVALLVIAAAIGIVVRRRKKGAMAAIGAAAPVAPAVPIQPTPASPAASASPVTTGAWQCRACAAANIAEARFCVQCGAARPQPAGWVCAACGRRNEGAGRFCQACGAPRAVASEWRCPGCGKVNRLTDRFCTQCGAPREGT